MNQRWKITYIDDKSVTDSTGKAGLDPEWGFHSNRPFYIRSKMPGKRAIEV
jgi:hypothetical protein